tara:strand:- start:553 stop:945 length:393 start_codon:yes stop_codon:yes gene_type:complete
MKTFLTLLLLIPSLVLSNIYRMSKILLLLFVFSSSSLKADTVPLKIIDNSLVFDVMVCNNCLVADEYWKFTTSCILSPKYTLKICTNCLTGKLTVRVCDNKYLCSKVDKTVCVTNPKELSSKTLNVLGLN